jgi:hypothetical protein
MATERVGTDFPSFPVSEGAGGLAPEGSEKRDADVVRDAGSGLEIEGDGVSQ